jgi:Ni/Co efflux regulator RcnB
MKRLILTLAAAASLAAPLAIASPAAAEHGEGHRGGGDHEGGRGGDQGGGQGGGHDRQGGGPTRDWSRSERGGGREGRWEGGRRGDERGDDERGGDGRRGEWERPRDWDDRRHNGYWLNNRWFYGPPPPGYAGSPLYRPGYSSWRRGGYLPRYYSGWVVSDYWRYRLRRPPFGYHWVRIGGDYLLVSDRTSIIFDIITGGF